LPTDCGRTTRDRELTANLLWMFPKLKTQIQLAKILRGDNSYTGGGIIYISPLRVVVVSSALATSCQRKFTKNHKKHMKKQIPTPQLLIYSKYFELVRVERVKNHRFLQLWRGLFNPLKNRHFCSYGASGVRRPFVGHSLNPRCSFAKTACRWILRIPSRKVS
jgi:hypothetical protein